MSPDPLPRLSAGALPHEQCSPWHLSRRRRALDFCLAAFVLLLLSPVLVLIALLIRLTSPGPALFRQTRVGVQGRDFTILKFRTMRMGAPGSQRSAANDQRITQLGCLLRRHKLDELPQLLHVLSGKMSLVGPRPKLRDHHSVEWHLRPGVTGAASVAFAAEEVLLRNVPHEELEAWHRALITPHKVALDLHYASTATFRSDLHLLIKTLLRTGRYRDLAEIEAWRSAHPQPNLQHTAPDVDVPARRGYFPSTRAELLAVWPISADSASAAAPARKLNR